MMRSTSSRCFFDDLLDARGVDPPVLDQRRQRAATDLATHGIEAGDGDRLGRVIDDDVDTGGLLEGADVASLAADDPTLHLVRGERDGGRDDVADHVRCTALDAGHDDLASALLARVARLHLDLADDARGVVPRLVGDGAENLCARLLRCELRDAGQLGARLLFMLFQMALAILHGAVALVELPGSLLGLVESAIEFFPALAERFLISFQLAALAADLLVSTRTNGQGFVLGRQHGFSRRAFGLLHDIRCRVRRRLNTATFLGPEEAIRCSASGDQAHQRADEGTDDGLHGF